MDKVLQIELVLPSLTDGGDVHVLPLEGVGVGHLLAVGHAAAGALLTGVAEHQQGEAVRAHVVAQWSIRGVGVVPRDASGESKRTLIGHRKASWQP